VADLRGGGGDVSDPGGDQHREGGGDLIEAAGGLGDDARPAQDRNERGQHQLAADPDGGGQDVQEEADGVPADGEHPAIFPLPFAVRRLGSGRYYGSGNGRGDDVA
jgi:hypothetical protein